jgi:hypothetical protein
VNSFDVQNSIEDSGYHSSQGSKDGSSCRSVAVEDGSGNRPGTSADKSRTLMKKSTGAKKGHAGTRTSSSENEASQRLSPKRKAEDAENQTKGPVTRSRKKRLSDNIAAELAAEET